jgi:hypothetical protein
MSSGVAVKMMLGLLVCVMLFHLSIIVKLIPYQITWGGRLKSDTEMYVFETIFILINLLLFFAVLIKEAYVKAFIPLKAVNAILWSFIGLFGLNTIGNIFAETNIEKSFSLLTLISVVLLWIIIRNSKSESKPK